MCTVLWYDRRNGKNAFDRERRFNVSKSNFHIFTPLEANNFQKVFGSLSKRNCKIRLCHITEEAIVYDYVILKLISILRRQYGIILTASWKKIYSVLGGIAVSKSQLVLYHDSTVFQAKRKKSWRLLVLIKIQILTPREADVHECWNAQSNLCFAENLAKYRHFPPYITYLNETNSELYLYEVFSSTRHRQNGWITQTKRVFLIKTFSKPNKTWLRVFAPEARASRKLACITGAWALGDREARQHARRKNRKSTPVEGLLFQLFHRSSGERNFLIGWFASCDKCFNTWHMHLIICTCLRFRWFRNWGETAHSLDFALPLFQQFLPKSFALDFFNLQTIRVRHNPPFINKAQAWSEINVYIYTVIIDQRETKRKQSISRKLI